MTGEREFETFYLPEHTIIELKYGEYYETSTYGASELKYHSSWGWIMPVWEKIVLSKDPYMISGAITTNFCRIDVLGIGKPKFDRFSNNSTIDAVWLTVIDYIKWYNEINGIT